MAVEANQSLNELLVAISMTTQSLESAVGAALGHPEHHKRRCFRHIPLDIVTFASMMKVAMAACQTLQRQVSFLDVGCGLGTKLQLMRLLHPGIAISGIEINEQYAQVARTMCEDCDIRVQDATRFEEYSQFNLIYFFRPLQYLDQESELESMIFDQCKPGTIVCAAYSPIVSQHRLPSHVRLMWQGENCCDGSAILLRVDESIDVDLVHAAIQEADYRLLDNQRDYKLETRQPRT